MLLAADLREWVAKYEMMHSVLEAVEAILQSTLR